MSYHHKPNFNNISTRVPGKSGNYNTDSLNSRDFQAIQNSRLYVKNMPPEILHKLQNGQINQLGPDFNCYVRMSPNKPKQGQVYQGFDRNFVQSDEFETLEDQIHQYSPNSKFQYQPRP